MRSGVGISGRMEPCKAVFHAGTSDRDRGRYGRNCPAFREDRGEVLRDSEGQAKWKGTGRCEYVILRSEAIYPVSNAKVVIISESRIILNKFFLGNLMFRHTSKL